MSAAATHPCDESGEDTGKSEQWRNTRDRFALVEEQLERRTKKHEVDSCNKAKHVG